MIKQVKFLQERFGLKREQIIVRETNAKVWKKKSTIVYRQTYACMYIDARRMVDIPRRSARAFSWDRQLDLHPLSLIIFPQIPNPITPHVYIHPHNT